VWCDLVFGCVCRSSDLLAVLIKEKESAEMSVFFQGPECSVSLVMTETIFVDFVEKTVGGCLCSNNGDASDCMQENELLQL
jgi:hypothetical protein